MKKHWLRFLSAPLVLAFTLVSVPAYAAGHVGACAPQPKTRVEVQLLDPAPKIITTLSSRQINSKAQAHGLLRRGNVVLGLTQNAITVSMKINFSSYAKARGSCLNVPDVAVKFGHKQLNIQVPREYVRGSCQYTTVLKHEMQHVRVNRTGVRKYAKILKGDLQRAVARFNPGPVSSMQSGQARAQQVLKQVVARVTAQLNTEITAQHARIDQPGGAYDAAGVCGDW